MFFKESVNESPKEQMPFTREEAQQKIEKFNQYETAFEQAINPDNMTMGTKMDLDSDNTFVQVTVERDNEFKGDIHKLRDLVVQQFDHIPTFPASVNGEYADRYRNARDQVGRGIDALRSIEDLSQKENQRRAYEVCRDMTASQENLLKVNQKGNSEVS